jgi:hypothetical protein
VTRRNEIGAVYGAGVVQGVALVTFPATSTILTSPAYYGLTSTAYGGLFVPQAVTAIAASLLGGGLTRRWGLKRVYLLGLLADLVAMALLPLTIGFGQEELAGASAGAAGGLIAAYQVGYGLAAFGVGPLERFAGLPLSTIYGWTTVAALALGALSFVIVLPQAPQAPQAPRARTSHGNA